MLGVFVCYAVFNPSYRHPYGDDLAAILFLSFITLPLFPFTISVMMLIYSVLSWHDQNYLISAADFVVAFAFVPLWWGVWYALYGRHNPAHPKFLRP